MILRNNWTSGNRNRFLEGLTAELTEAAYAVALRHEAPGSWIDLELDLWKALGDTIQRRVTESAGQREQVGREAGGVGQRRYARLPVLQGE